MTNPTVEELIELARFRRLDARNCNEEAKDRLLGLMADEIERLQAALHRIGFAVSGVERHWQDFAIRAISRPASDVSATQQEKNDGNKG